MKSLLIALALILTATTARAEIYVNGKRTPNVTASAISCQLANGVEFSSTGPRERNHLPVSSFWFGFQKDFIAHMEEYKQTGVQPVTISLEPMRMFDNGYKLVVTADLALRTSQKVEGVMSNYSTGDTSAAKCDLTLEYNDEQY